MKKAAVIVAFLGILASARVSFAAEDREYYTSNLYITSYYTVEIYNNNRKVGILYAGTRARIIKSHKHWLYVEFWDGRKYVKGWMRR